MNNLKFKDISGNKVFFFILRLWIFTNIISAFITVLINDYNVNGVINYTSVLFEKVFWQAVFFVICIGLIYSATAMLILGLLIALWPDKLILIIGSILLVMATFYFSGLMAFKKPATYIPAIIYSVVISILIFMNDLNSLKSKS